MSFRARTLIVAVIAVALPSLLAAPAALAGSASVSGETIAFNAGAAEVNDVTITPIPGGVNIDDDNHAVSDGGGCSAAPGASMNCLGTVLNVDLGDMDDSLLSSASLHSNINGGPGGDEITSGSGDDFISGLSSSFGVTAGDGVDVINGRDGVDRLYGGPENDTLRGGNGNDLIEMGVPSLAVVAGNDSAEGGNGDDAFGVSAVAGDGADTYSGGDGVDTATFPSPAGSTASLDGAANDGRPGEGDNVLPDVENLSGSSGNDHFTGSGGANTLDGVAGDDVLNGAGGNDTLRGGPGDPGNDSLDGGDGDDLLDGGPGDDSSAGAPGRDTILGGGGSDLADGGDDADTVEGGPGIDDLSGGAGDDSLRGADPLGIGGDGGDSLKGDAGSDVVIGDGGDDVLNGGEGGDSVSGGPGIDRGSYERVRSPVTVSLDDQANDGVAGEGDNIASDVEDVTGGDDENTVTGSPSPNALQGGSGEDYVDGDAETDTLVAGASGDTVRSRDGTRDLVQCGDGPDFAIADAEDSVSGECERTDRGNSRPRLGRTIVVAPTAARAQGNILGALAMQLPKVNRFVPLVDKVGLPAGTVIDASRRSVALRYARRGRGSRAATLSGGRFRMRQSRRTGVAELALRGGNFSRCNRRSRDAGAAQRRRIRRLRGRTRGRHRFRGRYSAGTTRGTRLVVEDRCDGTLTRVLSGSVAVHDFAKSRTVVLRRGQQYLARPRRR